MRMDEVTADLLDMAEEILCLFRYSHWNTPIHARLPSLTLLKMNGLPIQPERCKVGELLSGDIIGKIQPPTRDGNVYFYLFVDKKTGYMRACRQEDWIHEGIHYEKLCDCFRRYNKLLNRVWAQSEIFQIRFRTDNEIGPSEAVT